MSEIRSTFGVRKQRAHVKWLCTLNIYLIFRIMKNYLEFKEFKAAVCENCGCVRKSSTCTVEKVIFEDEPNIFSNSALLT